MKALLRCHSLSLERVMNGMMLRKK